MFDVPDLDRTGAVSSTLPPSAAAATAQRRTVSRRAPTTERLRAYRRTGDRRLRNGVVEEHMGLATSIARGFGRTSEPADDLAQVALLGLVKAAERFDPDHGSPFEPFAAATIRGELRRHFRDHGWTIRVPRSLQELRYEIRAGIEALGARLGRSPTTDEVAAHLGVDVAHVIDALCADRSYRPASLDAQVGDDRALSERLGATEPGLDRVDDDVDFVRLVERCPPRLRRIVRLRYVHQLKQDEIAARLGCSQVHISRLLKQAHGIIGTALGTVSPAR